MKPNQSESPNLYQELSRFVSQDDASVAILTALLLTVCLGFAGLAIDVGLWYSQKRQLQLAADAGAVGGTFALGKGGSSTVSTYVTYDVGLNGCTASNNCTITVNNPPTSGTNTGNSNAVEVILSKPAQLYLLSIFLASAPTLTARAVAKSGLAANCLTLLGTGSTVLSITGSASVTTALSCGVYSNSSSNSSITVSGSSQFTTKKISTAGGLSQSGSSTITTTPPGNILTNQPVVTNPYAGFTIPSFPACSSSINISGSSTNTVNPGSYCSFSVSGSGTVTMNPGIYYIDGGNFSITGSSTVSGNGVTVVMTSTSGSNFGNVSISGSTTTNFSAPSTGATAGYVFVGDPRTPTNTTYNFTGSSGQNISGIIYTPSVKVNYSGSSVANPCLIMAVASANFTGSAAFSNTCGGGGGGGGASGQSLLVE